MKLQISRSVVFQALGQVRHPEIQSHNLVELGMIPEVIVEGTQVFVILALPSLNASIKDELLIAVRQAVTGLEDGLEVKVEVTEMFEDQHARISTPAREAQLISNPLAQISKFLAVMSGKEVAGKSSVAGLLASTLQRRGYQVKQSWPMGIVIVRNAILHLSHYSRTLCDRCYLYLVLDISHCHDTSTMVFNRSLYSFHRIDVSKFIRSST
jgi:metal-sulfur cluster biosynthetic enzyme